MSAKYLALLTNIGAAKLANATALGSRLNITQMAVGDGGGVLPTPNPAQIALINEKRRAALNSLSVDPKNPSQIIAEQVIPETEGGWWIREIGLFDDDGNLIAVANCPETYKPQLQEGSGRIQTVRMILIVSSTDAVALKIDPAVVLATRSYVDNAVIEVKAYTDNVMRLHLAATDPHPQYAPKASPTLTGKPTAPTATQASNDMQLATTAFVKSAIAALVNGSPGALDTLQELASALGNDPAFSTTVLNAIADAKADAANKLNAHTAAADPHSQYAPKISPVLTGTPTAPTAGAAANDAQIATTAFVKAAIAALVNGSPAALDTLQELASALGNDPNFSTTILNALAGKLAKDQLGADIPNKKLFAKNASVPYLGSGWVDFGATSGTWTTSQFIDFLNEMGAFEHGYFVCAGTWSYSTNKKIIDTGCGHVELAGAVVEVFASRFNLRTVRVTTMSSSSDPGAIQGQFVYVESETTGSGEWRREFNTKNLTPADIGALTTEGTAAAAAKLAIARTINGVAFDGTASISLTPANIDALPAAGTAVAASKLAMPRKINGVVFDGSSDIDIGPRVWISSEYTPATSTPIVVSHGLVGINPLHCRCDVLVKCITAEGGYQAGDFAINPMTLFMQNDIAHPYCLQPALNTSTVQLNIMHHLSASFKTSTIGNQYLNMANWRCIIRIFY
nr:phage tail protein [Pectobacterium brasiliense]